MRDLIDLVKTMLLEEREQWPALEPDPEDSMRPQPMTEPRVLYRSVSVAELKDIWMRSEVTGGRNHFNDVDPRRYVFFADYIDPVVIRQGEEIDRQGVHRLKDHEIHSRFRMLGAEIEDQARMILHIMQGANLKYDPVYEKGFLRGDYVSNMQSAMQGVFGTVRGQLRDAFQELRELVEKKDALQREYRELLRAEWQTLKAERETLPITSAIIVTKPITGGLHYSRNHGQSGMEGDEFGFASGQVTSEDLSEVIFIKGGKEVDSCPYEELGERLAQMGLY